MALKLLYSGQSQLMRYITLRWEFSQVQRVKESRSKSVAAGVCFVIPARHQSVTREKEISASNNGEINHGTYIALAVARTSDNAGNNFYLRSFR